jgi:adenosylhomocysteine nucleosidase
MILITLAHLGEAEELSKNLALERATASYFQGSDYDLVLTGEGPMEAAIKTAAALAKKSFEKVINIGIAGALSPKFEIGSVHEIRTCYLVIDGKPQFKSFSATPKGIDLLTSMERILKPEKAEVLKGMGQLVDREAWGVAMAAKEAGVPFQCLKVVSDQAGSLEACELVREKVDEFARIISLALVKQNNPEIDLGRDFHFTFTTQKALESKLKKLTLREGKSVDEVLGELRIDELRQLKILPKERARRLLLSLDQELDPFKGRLHQELESWKEEWGNKGISLQTDPTWESAKVRVSFEVESDQELSEKRANLNDLDLQTFIKLRTGEFNFEL